MNPTIYDLAVIGGGPAGAAAAVYAARKRLKTVFITKDWLGQSNVSEKIENWVGTVAISGFELSQSLEKHAKAYEKGIIDFKEGESCVKIESNASAASTGENSVATLAKPNEGTLLSPRGRGGVFLITTDKGNYEARAILVTAGSRRRKLDVPGSKEYENKGIVYCATCDGPLYSDQDVAVIGGGNAGFEGAVQLMAYCRSVTLLARNGFKADPSTIEAVSKNPKVKLISFATPKEVKGGKFVTSLTYTETKTGTDVKIPVTGIFVEIGSLPNTDFVKDLVKLDSFNRIIVDAKNQRASLVADSSSDGGIWAAGDATDGLYHQNNIAAGDAVKAVEDIYIWLQAKK